MSRSEWMPFLQVGPTEAPLTWYIAGFVLVLLIIIAAFGVWMIRTESSRQPVVDPEQLINSFDEPLAILDPAETVLVANVPFRKQFGAEIVGDPVEDVLEEYHSLRTAVTEREEGIFTFETDGSERKYQLRLYPIGRQPRPPQKWVVLLHDVTSHHEKQAQLQAKNEQLDQFASLISHDLRNPLDVAIGRTTAVREALDDPELERHLERTEDSHKRMRQIITDVLALAREGHSIGDTVHVPLETAAMDAWSHVDTDDAELTVSTQLVIEADEERLTRIFENLFRNTVQHVGTDARVEVGELDADAGFFVADNGDGIDPAEREMVFQTGYSNGDAGTGLGLAIVASIASAHGWEVTVTDSTDGGARFEFSNVTEVADEFATKKVE